MRAIDADAISYESIDSCDTGRHEHYYGTGIIAVRKEDIDAMPTIQPEPHWIPVTERLPETSDAVLTTYIVNGDRSRRYVEESSYYENDESWSSPWDEYRIAGTRIEVIAWMPLPEPYKGVTNGRD